MSEEQSSTTTDDADTGAGGDDDVSPDVRTVHSTIQARRDDVPEDELRERSKDAVDDLTQGTVTAFTTPLAVNRVRDEVNEQYGSPETGSSDSV